MDRGLEVFEFQHFRFPSVSQSAGVTFAFCDIDRVMRRHPKVHYMNWCRKDPDKRGMLVAVAFCDPSEKNFSKKQGRRVAARKFSNSAQLKHVIYVDQGDRHSMAVEALRKVSNPKWYRDAVVEGLV